MDPLYDTHVHVWDPGVLDLPWLKGSPAFDRIFSWQEYLRDAQSLGITEAIYMEVDAKETSFDAELAVVKDLLNTPGTILRGAVMGGRPGSPDFASWLDVLAGDPRIRGVRETLHTPSRPAGRCLDPAYINGVRLMGERGFTFDACMRVGELADAASLAAACPDTTIVLDHLGNPPISAGVSDSWRRALEALAAEPNMVGKMSGLIQNADGETWSTEDFAPFMECLLEAFGPERVVWGSNWPVCTLKGSLSRWVATTHEVLQARSEPERAAVLHGNAPRLYGLD